MTIDRNRNSKISNMLNRSQSYSSFQLLDTSPSSPTTTEEEDASLLYNWSSWSLHKPPLPRHTSITNEVPAATALSTTSSTVSTGSFSKRFHSSHLGRPPPASTSNNRSLQQKPLLTNKLSTSLFSIHQQQPNISKIAPMKEVEKMIADLKKENFDLKLRLYHLEDLLNKDLDLYHLNQENHQLKMNLEDRTRHLEGLERELNVLLVQQQQRKKKSYSTGTQTEEQKTTSSPVTPTSTQDSYHTAFESSPEAFGLLPVSKSTLALQHSFTTPTSTKKEKKEKDFSWQKDHLSSVVSQLQNFKLMEEEEPTDNNNNNIDLWLSQNVNNHQQGNLTHPSYHL